MQDGLPSAVGDALARDQGRRPVECRETHGSWVFLAGDRALKVKKPVVLPFLDYGTLERRRAMCREEVRLNRRLAPGLYRGTVSVVARDGGLFIDPDDEAPEAVEVAVDMRRYDEGDTLAERLRTGAASPAQVRAVGAGLAAFHAAQARPRDAERAFAALWAAVRTTLDDLQGGGAPGEIDDDRLWQLRGVMEAALAAGRRAVIDATLGEPAARDALRHGLGPAAAQLRYVECRVPTAEAQARGLARQLDAECESDATGEVTAQLAASWTALDEVPAGCHLVLRADRSPRKVMRDLAAWLDRAWT